MNGWFPEPDPADHSEHRRGAAPQVWLPRSHLPVAVTMRRFLNETIAYLPANFQTDIVQNLQTRWDSAYFELIVARSLQILGATIVVEPVSDAGTRIDFVADFPDGVIAVEAISPQFNVSVETTARNRLPLLNIIESLVPDGWSVSVGGLPAIGPNDSRNELRGALKKLFAIAPPQSLDDPPRELTTALTTGHVQVMLIPRQPGWSAIVSNSQFWIGDDSDTRIRKAIHGKRRQARNAALPALVAIGVHIGTGITRIDAFERALFGDRVATLEPGEDDQPERWRLNGVFATKGDGEPTHAGVLAFPHIGLGRTADPVLFHHPRSTVIMPSALQGLEQRRMTRKPDGVITQDAQATNVLAVLNPLQEAVMADEAARIE